MRTHRSHIVNLDRVHTIEREDEQYRVVLDTKDKARVPISRNRADKVRDYFGLV
jgi:DNA-binding LytR/AlgR family response regulator